MSNKTQTVLITGASSGIGLDIAKGFLERGSNVVMNARNSEKLAAAARVLGDENRIAIVPGDIGNKETGEKMVRTAVERFGSVDVLVNNAGIFGLKPFLENSEEDIDNYIRINLKGTYFVTQAVVRQMKQQGGGSIVNIGTVLIMHSMAGVPASAALYGEGDVDAFGGVALMNRVGEVRETTEAVIHLATAGFTTGVILPVDGGYVHGRA
jgi:NAD(P)-dependent dehydrogenase (short-subunit alcohol dehydrogenase family)